MGKIKNIVRKVKLNYNIDNFVALVNISAHLLDISNDISVYIMPMNKNLDKDYHAFIHKVNDFMYIIYIKENTLKKNKINNFNIHMILHEMGHLLQYNDKRLIMSEDNKSVIWEGIKYDNNYPYNERP